MCIRDSRNGRFIIDNISHRVFLGVTKASEIEGTMPSDFFPPALAGEMEKDLSLIHI